VCPAGTSLNGTAGGRLACVPGAGLESETAQVSRGAPCRHSLARTKVVRVARAEIAGIPLRPTMARAEVRLLAGSA